jgi:ubiquinone/menaquinone biosynthesis C-methylase UbiE
MSNADAVRNRFAATAERVAEHAQQQIDALSTRVAQFAELRGDERAVDAGTGAGTLALALARHVREVVGVDLVPELLAQARRLAAEAGVENVSFVEGDAAHMPFDAASFDFAGTLRTLHHTARPELVVAELARVTRPGGYMLVVDQIAPADPLVAIELDRFERARDPSHTRALPDGDVRALFEANGLVLRRSRVESERRELDRYLDLAGCEGEARAQARSLSPGGPAAYTAEVGWYLFVKPVPR